RIGSSRHLLPSGFYTVTPVKLIRKRRILRALRLRFDTAGLETRMGRNFFALPGVARKDRSRILASSCSQTAIDCTCIYYLPTGAKGGVAAWERFPRPASRLNWRILYSSAL